MKRSAAREAAVRLCYSAEIAGMENAEFVADFLMKHEVMDDEQFACAMKEDATMEEVESLVTEKKRRSQEENRRRQERAEREKQASIKAQLDERRRMEAALGLSDDDDEEIAQIEEPQQENDSDSEKSE